MDERIANDLAMRSFLLGVQVAMHVSGTKCDASHMNPCLDTLRHIVDGDFTLVDPESRILAPFDSATKKAVGGVNSAAIEGQAALALRIQEGFRLA
jgi:hypothetical protein